MRVELRYHIQFQHIPQSQLLSIMFLLFSTTALETTLPRSVQVHLKQTSITVLVANNQLTQ